MLDNNARHAYVTVCCHGCNIYFIELQSAQPMKKIFLRIVANINPNIFAVNSTKLTYISSLVVKTTLKFCTKNIESTNR